MSLRSHHQVHHLGRLGELVPIILMNLLFQILTLGLYRFWAITRIRQYLWSRTLFDDDPLEYTGTGKEIFIGFLLAAVVVLVPLGVLQSGAFLAQAADETGLAIVLWGLYGALIMLLMPIALFRARRYRLSRTVWRGIRWGQSGSAMSYALLMLGYSVFVVITLGLAYPWQSIALERYRLNHTYFGNQPLDFDGTAKPLFGRWLVVWAMTGGMVLVCTVLAGIAYQHWGVSAGDMAPKAEAALGGVSVLVLGLAMIGSLVGFAWYKAGELRYIAENTRYQGLRFTCTVTGGQLIWLVISNTVLRVLTLGLMASYTLVRTARLMARTLSAEGEVDFERVRQNSDQRTLTGEGLASALSMGEF